MSNFDDIMDLLGPSVPSYSGPGLEEISRPLPPAVQDTTGDADVWLPTSVAAHYKEYDRSGTAVDDLEALIARDGLLTPIRISTDGRVAVVHEGNHRLQVAQRLGISEVPAIVTFDDPVVSNGGRVTPLEPVLGSWVEQNRGRLRSFWGYRTAASAGKLYRGVRIDLGIDLSLAQPGTSIETVGQELQLGPQVLDALSRQGGLGTHWSTRPEIAERFALESSGNGGGTPALITVDWNGSGEDLERTNTGGTWTDEAEVTLLPGTPITVTSVKLGSSFRDGVEVLHSDRYLGYASDFAAAGLPVPQGGPQQRTAEWQPWHSDDQEEAQEIAPGTTIYRGMKVDFSDSDFDQIWRWQQPPLVEEERGQHFKIGPFILDRLEPLGIHWTTKKRIAEIGASQGGYGGAGVIIEAEYTGTGQDLRGTAYHNDGWSAEEEITMLPGAQVRITGVFLTGIEKNKNLLRGPELRSAHRTAGTLRLYHGTTADNAEKIKVEGLRPPAGIMMPAQWFMLTDSFEQAARYAPPNNPVVLEFVVPETAVYSRGNSEAVLWAGEPHDVYGYSANAYAVKGTLPPSYLTDIRTVTSGRTAGTRTDPGGVYRGINVQVLSHDEQQELAEWANANAFSLYDYQLAEPNYELVYRILDRLDSGGLGRHWSKDYDVSASFARDQGDGIELILIGHWEGEGVDTREFHRGYDDVLRPSNLPHEEEVTLYPGTPVTLVGMDIVTETGFTYNIPVPNIQVTAGHDMKHLANRTAANDLRVHLFDSEGHEMFLEPDFDGNPWTYHPKVMDAVRYLADVAQEDGVYWHMDHNEFIPSTITDFKVFDGPNDVTHEIKEFPQLRGFYASRTAYVSDDIYESYYDTDRLVNLVMSAYTWDGNGPLWELVANSPEEAKAFFDSLDEDERRVNVSEVLENGGWDLSGIGHKFSNRTSASTPSAPGILYRGLAVPFSEAQLEDVMEAYGKDSFVGRVLGYLSRGFFTPSREWGLGKHWTTNINVAKSFSQNGFGTPVVLVAEWDGSGEDPYNAPGNNFGGEDEVTLLPGTELRLVDVLWGPTFESIGGSGRTIIAAEPGGVLPWTPSHRGYTWITHSDGTLEAVTNDAVNRMFLTEEPWGWEWEVFDSLGFVEGGTFGMALKGGDALRDRANDLLAEFDTRAERRTRGPSRGYQDDYTQAPNTLWSKRATTSQRYAERLRREGRR